MRVSPKLLLLLLATCLVVAAGCGGDDDDSSSGGGGDGGAYGGSGGGSAGGGGKKLKLSADPSGALRFDKTSLSAPAGKVTIVMDNPSELPHAIEIEGKGVEEEGETVGKGGVSRASAELEPGKYEFYCPVDSHKQQGMEGTLTVR